MAPENRKSPNSKTALPAPPQPNPQALRALQEAAERHRAARETAGSGAREVGGRGGLDPVRYGDWEVKGLISDF